MVEAASGAAVAAALSEQVAKKLVQVNMLMCAGEVIAWQQGGGDPVWRQPGHWGLAMADCTSYQSGSLKYNNLDTGALPWQIVHPTSLAL